MSSRCQETECFCTYNFCAPLWNKWNSNNILSFSLSWGFNKKSCSCLFYYFCKIINEARGLEAFFQLGGSHKYDNSLSRLLFILLLCVSCFILVVRFHFLYLVPHSWASPQCHRSWTFLLLKPVWPLLPTRVMRTSVESYNLLQVFVFSIDPMGRKKNTCSRITIPSIVAVDANDSIFPPVRRCHVIDDFMDKWNNACNS